MVAGDSRTVTEGRCARDSEFGTGGTPIREQWSIACMYKKSYYKYKTDYNFLFQSSEDIDQSRAKGDRRDALGSVGMS